MEMRSKQLMTVLCCVVGRSSFYPALCGSSGTDQHIRFSVTAGVGLAFHVISAIRTSPFSYQHPSIFHSTFSPFQFVRRSFLNLLQLTMAITNGHTGQIPVIDISGPLPEPEIAAQLVDAAATYGFVYVKNEGKDIPVEAIESLFDLV
jgi:hypothetical protein